MLAVCWQYQGSRTAVVVYRRNPGRCAWLRVPRVWIYSELGILVVGVRPDARTIPRDSHIPVLIRYEILSFVASR